MLIFFYLIINQYKFWVFFIRVKIYLFYWDNGIKSFGYYDKPLTELDSGTIWLSHDNMEECRGLVQELSVNEDLRDEYRNKSYEVYSYYAMLVFLVQSVK